MSDLKMTNAGDYMREIDALKEELNSVNEYKDKLNTAVHVLLDQVKSGEVTLGAMYDVDVLLGD